MEPCIQHPQPCCLEQQQRQQQQQQQQQQRQQQQQQTCLLPGVRRCATSAAAALAACVPGAAACPLTCTREPSRRTMCRSTAGIRATWQVGGGCLGAARPLGVECCACAQCLHGACGVCERLWGMRGSDVCWATCGAAVRLGKVASLGCFSAMPCLVTNAVSPELVYGLCDHLWLVPKRPQCVTQAPACCAVLRDSSSCLLCCAAGISRQDSIAAREAAGREEAVLSEQGGGVLASIRRWHLF